MPDFHSPNGLTSGSAKFAEPGGAELAAFDDPVMVLDLEDRVLSVNDAAKALARRLGVPLDQGTHIGPFLANARLVNGIGSQDWPLTPVDLDVSDTAAEPLPGEVAFELRSALRIDADGRAVDRMVRLIDATSLVAALHGKKEAEGHRDRLLKLLSHDMRTPLAAILATLKRPDLAAMPTHLRDVIESAAHSALSMVDSNVRLIRARCSDYRFVELNFCHVIEEAIDASWALAKQRGIRIVLEPTTVPFQILADRGYLTEALNEILAYLVDKDVPNRTLLCSLSHVTSGGIPSVELVIEDSKRRRSVVAKLDDPLRSTVTTLDKLYAMHDGDLLDLFRTVVTRHRGTVIWQTGVDSTGAVSVTIPSFDAALQPS